MINNFEKRLGRALAEGSDTHPTGTMVGLWVPAYEAKQLAVPGGEPWDELHITLAYLGKGLSRSLISKLAGVCAAYAALRPPMTGLIAAADRFPPSQSSDWREVLIARPEVPGLLRFREGLVRRLENAGATVSRNFEFSPHITLAYVQPGRSFGIGVSQVPLRFQDLVLATGEVRQRFPLGGNQR